MPELNALAKIDVKMPVAQMNRHYDVIVQQDLLSKLGIILDFEQQLVWWGGGIVKIRPTECTQETSYFVNHTPYIAAETDRMSKMLDAKYQPADLDKVEAKNMNLTLEQRNKLHKLLKNMKPFSIAP